MALGWIPETQEKTGNRRLAGAGRADERHGAASRDGKGHARQCRPCASRIGEVDIRHLQGDVHFVVVHGHTGSVGHLDRLGIHGMDPARGAQGIGELAAHLGDLGDGQEGRHGEQGEQGQDAAVEAAVKGQNAADHDDREPAEPGHHLLQRCLHGEVAQVRCSHLRERPRLGGEFHTAPPNLLERDDLSETLDGVDGEGAEIGRCLPSVGAQAIDPAPAEDRAESRVGEEGQER